MPNLTVRDIPDDVFNKIKILSQVERRSINNEILLIIENGLKQYTNNSIVDNHQVISKESQLKMWSNLSGKWEDDKKTEDIIHDLYSRRTNGRDVEL